MKKALLIVLTITLLIPSISDAQRWKRQRYEFSFGAGVSNFLGELGTKHGGGNALEQGLCLLDQLGPIFGCGEIEPFSDFTNQILAERGGLP